MPTPLLRLLSLFAAFVFLLVFERPSALTCRAQDFKDDGGSISGRITVQGNPGANLLVGLFRESTQRGEEVASTVCDSEGRFRFTDIAPDYYLIKVLSANHVIPGQWHLKQGLQVTLRRGESIDDANCDVLPGGAISGRITDVDGDPVRSERILLFPANASAPNYEAVWFEQQDFRTDATGAYRVFGISPGRYVVGIGEDIPRITGAVRYKDDWGSAEGRVGRDHYYVQTFYPGVQTRDLAPRLEVSADHELTAIDFIVGRIQRAFRVSGRVIDAKTGKPVRDCHIQIGFAPKSISLVTSSCSLNGPSDVDASGSFSLPGFLPGRFFVNAVFAADSNLYGERVDFDVIDGDVDDIVIKACPGLTLSGSVVLDAPPPAPAWTKASTLKLNVSTVDSLHRRVFASKEIAVDSTGAFTVRGLPPGGVAISVPSCDRCNLFAVERVEYTRATSSGQIEANEYGSFVLDVDSDLQSLRVLLRSKGAKIRCHVDVVGKLAGRTRLMLSLTSQRGQSNWSTMRQLDVDGNVVITGLDSGEYTLEITDGNRRLTEPRKITLSKTRSAEVSYTIDASQIR